MLVRDFLDKLILEETDVVCIGETASYSRSKLYEISKNKPIFDKEISEIRIEVHDGWGDDGHGNEVLIGLYTLRLRKNNYVS